jgi:histidine triad (HIT) family protein
MPKWRNWQTRGTQNPVVDDTVSVRFRPSAICLIHQTSGVTVLSSTCIFCKIIQKTVPSTIIAENDHVIVVQDIAPKAPTHYLIIPKHHVESVLALTANDAEYCWHMMKIAQELGAKLPSKAFNLIVNNGAAAGQSIMHLHFHFLAGKNLYAHGVSL